MIATDPNVAALGRYVITLNPQDTGKFRTASLRNVAATAPYMHDGSVKSLAEAIELEIYSRGPEQSPLLLTEDERSDLLAFSEELTSPQARPPGEK